MSSRITCEPASNVPVHPTNASFQASGPRFTRNSDTMLWLPGGRNAVRSVIKSSRLVRPPMRLVAKPTMMSSAGKNARNKLKAIACEIMPQRGNTRAIIRIVRLKREGLEAIARHYTHGRPSAEAKPPPGSGSVSVYRGLGAPTEKSGSRMEINDAGRFLQFWLSDWLKWFASIERLYLCRPSELATI